MPELPHALERPPYDVAPPADTLGVRHVREALRDLPFPTTKEELLARAGHWRIPVTGAHFHELRELLEGVRAGRFRSAEAVVRAMERAHPAWRD